MTDIASEFINNKIIEAEFITDKSSNWQSFLYEKLIFHNDLIKEFTDTCKPIQNQIDFSRSVSLHNIFKSFKKIRKIPRKCIQAINRNADKFPEIKKNSYLSADNTRFEPILNLNLLKINSLTLTNLIFVIDNIEKKDNVLLFLKKTLENESDFINTRIEEIENKLKEIPDILTKELSKNNPNTNTDKPPKVSVITCSYNLARFVEETMKSIANQNCNNFEHIVIDGGSTDGSVELIKKYPHIILVSEKDGGPVDAIWKGLNLARGKYVMSCYISDCYASAEWINRCIETLDNNSDVSLVWGFTQNLTEDSKAGEIWHSLFHYKKAPQKQEMFSYWLKTNFNFPEGNLCVRKSVILKCYPTVEECEKGIMDWLEFNNRFNQLGYVSMHLPMLANFARIHDNRLGKRLIKSGDMRIRMKTFYREITNYKIKLLIGFTKHYFIDSEGNRLDLEFDKRRFINEDLIESFFRIDKKYFRPKRYYDFIKKRLNKVFNKIR